MSNIKFLDCTLRDGAYIVNGNFKDETIKEIIKNLINSNINIIECGWLKNDFYKTGSTYYHTPNDFLKYYIKNQNTVFCAMIDYNRYNTEFLPDYDNTPINTIRIAFPHDKVDEAISIAKIIKKKGYNIIFHLMNTFLYTDNDLVLVSKKINELEPLCVHIADTFGTMLNTDIIRIANILNSNLNNDIYIGLHTHNNQQLAFSLIIDFCNFFNNVNRTIVVDGSLQGMGRGAGNAPTELILNFLNKQYNKQYNLNNIINIIDKYIIPLKKDYTWGYSIETYIAGIFNCHINNISYLTNKYNINAENLKIVIENMDENKRLEYDYDYIDTLYKKLINK